jgi:hypothetical protein
MKVKTFTLLDEIKEACQFLELIKQDKISEIAKKHFNFRCFKLEVRAIHAMTCLRDDNDNTLYINRKTGMLDLYIYIPDHLDGFLDDLIELYNTDFGYFFESDIDYINNLVGRKLLKYIPVDNEEE